MDYRSRKLYLISTLFLFLLFFYIALSAPPKEFPSKQIITIKDGSGLYELSEGLKDDHVVRNASWFRSVAIILGGEKSMQAGDYYLPYPESVYTIAWKIMRGDHDIQRFKITIPEGFTVKKISALFDNRFPLFDQRAFLNLADEGYLFPDTYYIGVNATATSTASLLRSNFDKKIFPLTGEIERSGHSLTDIIKMASILESEAKTDEDKKIISGILWKRLTLGLPLQVDASFAYINGKTTKDLTQADLNIDSLYNSYLYKGLPPTPISNPGLESIEAAIHPTSTPYLYFLTDKDGIMHYARTFDEHRTNKAKYLQ